ncbi:MAG TPA: hypothetical protein VGK99_22225 [Acidobacteriota bacterium]|jgi:flagellar biosynthesis/type III secretory pathway protein FliH
MKAIAGKLFMAAALVLGLSVTAYAHDNKGSGSKEASYRTGYDDGYRDGLLHGEDDYRRGVGYDPSSQELKKTNTGRKIDHKGDYKKGYREGYLSGYREGYERRGANNRGRYPDSRYPDNSRYPDTRYPGGQYPNSRYPDTRYPGSQYPSNSRYPDSRNNTAFDMGLRQGYEDGVEKGRSDYDKNRSPDVNRHDWYRNADHNYRSSYGSKRDYQAGYRQGFEQGYYDNIGNYRGSNRRGSVWDQILGRRP